jgi:BirA family biotin operon repressor/biotin-[acetyl-CoA-carboxylase] ligase
VGLGRPHRHHRVTDSTNARARELVEAGAPHGTVVTADEQTAGRGRQGRSWTAPPGKALLYSAVLRPLEERHALLPLAVPLAVCETAEELQPGVACTVKWPNDVWVEGRKLAGVLIEAKPQEGWAVIGVGLNLAVSPEEYPPELRATAASLDGASPEAARRALDRNLGAWLEADRGSILEAWRSRDALRGRRISWDGGAGVAEGIDDSGDLLVLGAGEVHLSV